MHLFRAPQKVYKGALTNSKHWDSYSPRAGDVIVSTPPKSGTTWVQIIVALLISGNTNSDVNPSVNAPWFDIGFRDPDEIMARLDAQKLKRQIKTHTPLDGIPIYDDVQYISVYRHPIDVHFSARNHVANYSSEALKELGLDLGHFPDDPKESFKYFIEFEDLDHGSLRTIVNHYKQGIELKPNENVLRLHYADLSKDQESCVYKIADHIGVTHSTQLMQDLIKATTFNNMKSNANRYTPSAGQQFWRSDSNFFNSGTSNKWIGVLEQKEMAMYDTAISKLLSSDERAWLEWGNKLMS